MDLSRCRFIFIYWHFHFWDRISPLHIYFSLCVYLEFKTNNMSENVYDFKLHLSIINETKTGFTFKTSRFLFMSTLTMRWQWWLKNKVMSLTYLKVTLNTNILELMDYYIYSGILSINSFKNIFKYLIIAVVSNKLLKGHQFTAFSVKVR